MAAVCFSPDKADHANALDGGTVRGRSHRGRGRGRTCAGLWV